MYDKLCVEFVALLVLFLTGCSTVESRIKSNPQVYGLLSPADQALVRRAGSGKVCRKPLFTWPGAIPIGFVPWFDFFYSFGPYPYPFDPYPDVVSYEVPYKTVFFEGDRCTGWEYLRY